MEAVTLDVWACALPSLSPEQQAAYILLSARRLNALARVESTPPPWAAHASRQALRCSRASRAIVRAHHLNVLDLKITVDLLEEEGAGLPQRLINFVDDVLDANPQAR